MPASRPLTRHSAALAIAGLVAAGLVVASPAHAATFDGGGTFGSLALAIDDANAAGGADTITLTPGASITGAAQLVISDDLTIELDGATVSGVLLQIVGADVTLRGGTWIADAPEVGSVSAAGLAVGPTASLTLDRMTVVAVGTDCDAAIGGWFSAAGGPAACDGGSSAASGAITIVDSSVTATGGLYSAGIGAASRGDQGPITITGSTVTATGGFYGAGIGTGKDRVAGTIDIVDSTVTATGGAQSAGIGGGDRGHGGTLTIEGGSVTATGTGNAAGIGGGFAGNGGTTTITGDALVTATGGSFGAGIGGGIYGIGGTTSIGGTATVTATGRDGGPGIGSSYTSDPSGPTTITDGTPTLITASIQGTFDVASGAAVTLAPNGTMVLDGASSNAGTITVNAPSQIEIPSGDTLTNLVAIAGTGTLRGSGTIDNQGGICANVGSDLTLTGTAFLLEYALPDGGTEPLSVYDTTLSAGCRELLDLSTSEQILLGWTIGADGPYLTSLTDLTAEVPSGSATLEPVFADAVLTFEPTPSSSAAGELTTVRAFGPVPMGMNARVDLTEFVLLSGEITLGDVGGEFVSTIAGEQTITGTTGFITATGEVVLAGSFTHTTVAGPLDALQVDVSATTVPQGGSVDLTVDGRDAYGNEVVIPSSDVVVTSSVPTDVVDGLTVTFPTASPHVLTVAVGEVSVQVTIEVEPAAVVPTVPEPPTTSTPPAPESLAASGATAIGDALGLALLLLVLGPLLVRAAGRRRAA